MEHVVNSVCVRKIDISFILLFLITKKLLSHHHHHHFILQKNKNTIFNNTIEMQLVGRQKNKVHEAEV